MSPNRRYLFIALVLGVVLALVAKTIYDLFNGYAVVPYLIVPGSSVLTLIFNKVVQFVALGIPAFITGAVLRSRLPSMPRPVVLGCAVPWCALTICGITTALIRFGWPLLQDSVLYTLVEAFTQILTVLSVPAGLWLSVRYRSGSEEVAL